MRHWWYAALAVLPLMANALPGAARAASAPATLAPADTVFIGLTFLGNRYQVDTGRLAEARASDPAVRRYAGLMDTSHVAVEDKLVALLRRIGAAPPPASLLAGAYASLVRSLTAEPAQSFDRAYVGDQVDYQKANDALYRWELANGSSPELKRFATEVLPKIDDHLRQALALSASRP